jgi:hypothetical protein
MKKLINILFKKYLKRWLLKKPYAATVRGWDEWKTKTKTEFPIRFWIQETLTSAIDTWWCIRIAWPIRDFYWKLQHTYNPKHKYNTIVPRTLGPGYYDHDTRILHGIMEEVTDFYETGSKHIDWDASSDNHIHAYNELKRVYFWWKDEWPHREKYTIWGDEIPKLPTLPKEWGFMAALDEKYENTDEMKEWSRVSKIHHQAETDWIEMETNMLKRTIDIRKYMW